MSYQGAYTPYDIEASLTSEDDPVFQDDLPPKSSTISLDGPKLRTSANVGAADDDLLSPLVKIRDFTQTLQIHVGVAASVSSLCFLIWHYTSRNGFWWWIYPIFFFALLVVAQALSSAAFYLLRYSTGENASDKFVFPHDQDLSITGHIYFSNDRYTKGIATMLIIFNFMLFVTDALVSGGHPRWWIWPSGISIMAGVGFYYFQRYREEGTTSWHSLASYEFIIFNLLMYSAWIETRAVTPFPWFLIPFFISGIPLTIIYMRFVYHEMRMWTYISAGISEFAFLMFLIWGFVNSSWPWFIIIWAIAFVAIFGVWFTQRNKTGDYEEVGDSTFEPRPMPEFYPDVSIDPASHTMGRTIGFQNSVPADYAPEYQPTQGPTTTI